MRTLLSEHTARGLVVGLLALTSLGACSSTPVGIKQPDIVGTVVSVTNQEASIYVLLRDLQIPDPRGIEEKAINIQRNTSVLVRTPDGRVRKGSWSDIAVGVVLRVEHTPEEIRTDPLQYNAIRVEAVQSPQG